MKVLSCFAKVADKEKFRNEGYFSKLTFDETGQQIEFSQAQKEHIEEVYANLCALDDLQSFDMEVELSTAMTTFDMVNKVNKSIAAIVDSDKDKVIINLTLKFYDVVSRTWYTHKDRILVTFKYSNLKIKDGIYLAEYTYMLKMYLKDIIEQHASDISAYDIMNMLKATVENYGV